MCSLWKIIHQSRHVHAPPWNPFECVKNQRTFFISLYIFIFVEEITAPPNSLIGVEDGADTPRNAQESRDQCNALGAFPGTEAFANGAWRWRRPAPRPWFALDESTSSYEKNFFFLPGKLRKWGNLKFCLNK